jgi:hypothetical protein
VRAGNGQRTGQTSWRNVNVVIELEQRLVVWRMPRAAGLVSRIDHNAADSHAFVSDHHCKGHRSLALTDVASGDHPSSADDDAAPGDATVGVDDLHHRRELRPRTERAIE